MLIYLEDKVLSIKIFYILDATNKSHSFWGVRYKVKEIMSKMKLLNIQSGAAGIYSAIKPSTKNSLDKETLNYKSLNELDKESVTKVSLIEESQEKLASSNEVLEFVNLPRILKYELKKSFKGEGGRAQEGFFHVWFRGNNRYNVFYTDEDYIGFLKKCDIASAKHNSKITAFALMNNHVHLQVYSKNLTLFITSILVTFNRWFNKRKELSGRVFESPFNSYQLLTGDSVKKNMLYILTNPVSAGICANVDEYKWTSFHFIKEPKHNHLKNIIKIDTTIMESFYNSSKELSSAASKYLIQKHNYNSQSEISKFCSNAGTIKASSFPKTFRYNDSELASILNRILQNKQLSNISRSELACIVKILRKEYNATYRQIASLTHESYDDVRRMVTSISISSSR